MSTELDKAISKHREYVKMGLNTQAALNEVTKQLKSLREIIESRRFSETFNTAVNAEIHRLNIESSAMHVILRKAE